MNMEEAAFDSTEQERSYGLQRRRTFKRQVEDLRVERDCLKDALRSVVQEIKVMEGHMKKITILAVIALFLLGTAAWAGQKTITFQWTQLMTNTDGSVLTNLGGWHFYQGTTSNGESTTPVATVNFTTQQPTYTYQMQITVPDNAETTYYFKMDAFNTLGKKSDLSAEISAVADLLPPNTTITQNPPSISGSPDATFAFTSTEANSTFECKVDSGTFSSCISPKTYTALIDGSHTFQVRAKDQAGNTDASPASYTWTITTAQPNPPGSFTVTIQ